MADSNPARPAVLCGTLLVVVMALLSGCQRAAERGYVSSKGLAELDPELQSAVQQQLRKLCGTPSAPRLLGGSEGGSELLKHGAEVYQRNCEHCHGVTGDGAGLAAAYLVPRPRDYRRGIFKFTSTAYGSKPRPDDLRRTIERGVPGTSMPSFRLLPKRDLDAVMEYVLALTHRGELEERLIAQAESEGELPDETVEELKEGVLARWKLAHEKVVEPETKMPPLTAESIAAGAAIFQKRECFKCHGGDGRGGLAGGIEVGNDAWGQKDPAADLTSGMLHGGNAPLDVYRRISAGINGTPMPAFKDSFAKEPEAIWQLVHYVLSMAEQRRRGVQFPLGVAAVKQMSATPAKGSEADANQPAVETTP